jgi:hydrogenase nickel incorporation protein HypB
VSSARAIPACEAGELNRRVLRDAGVLAIELSGGAGAGKTTLLEDTLRRLHGRYRTGVIVANPTADRDARRLRAYGGHVIPVSAAAIDAHQLHCALCDMHLGELDVLFIETILSLTGSGSRDVGQDLRVAVLSVAGGDDKAAEFARGVADADLVLLNKLDLLPHVHFDTRVFDSDIRRLNLDAAVLKVSAAHGGGMDEWERWLGDQLRRVPRRSAVERLEPPEVFLG